MQLRKTSAFALYIGSYLPLGLVLLVQDLDPEAVKAGFCVPSDWSAAGCRSPLLHPWWSFGTVGLGAACLLLTLWTLGAVATPNRIRIVEAKHVPADLINYAMPYIVSFMGLDFASPTKLLGFGVFFLWIFWITYRSGQIVMNPILIVFGWRLFEIKYSYLQSGDQLVGRALSREEVEPNRTYRRGSLQDVMVVAEMVDGGVSGRAR
jgi:hypothetical protein